MGRYAGVMSIPNLSWDDLRYLDAIERTGSLRSASRDCLVSVPTLYRRVSELEAVVGQPCLVRRSARTTLTPLGKSLAQLGKRVHGGLTELFGELKARETTMTGVVSVTTVRAMLPFIRDALAGVTRAHPELTVELHLGDSGPSVRRREVDLSLSVVSRPPQGCVGKRVGTLVGGVYGRREQHGPRARRWVLRSFDEASSPESAWEREHVRVAPAMRATFETLVSLVADGVGVGLITQLHAREFGLAELTEFRASTAHLARPLWVLTHEDNRRSPRIAAVRTAIAEALEARC